MHFSDRTDWEATLNRVTAVLNDLKKSGEQIYDLTVSNPTRCGFHFFNKTFLNALLDERGLMYDPDPYGMSNARQAVVQYYASQGVDLREDQIFLTASTSEAYGFLFRLLVNPGQNVVFPKPSYPLFEFLSGIHDVQWRTYDLVYRKEWRLDGRNFRSAVNDQTRAVIVVNPNNPTGSCLNADEIKRIYQAGLASDIPIICDEVFLDYQYSPGCRTQTLAGEGAQLTFVLNGLSKLLALPQMKCSWIAMSGPDHLVAEARRRLEIIADTYLSVNTPVQYALPQWMLSRKQIQKEILDRVMENRLFLEEQLRLTGKRAKLLRADGGWSAVISCPGIEEEEFILSLLTGQKVFIHPGYFFDFQEAGYCVASLLPEKEIFQEGVRRLTDRIRA